VLGVTLTQRLVPFSATVVQVSGYVLGPLGRGLDLVMVEPLTRLIFGRPGHRISRESKLSTSELKTLLEMSRRRGLIDRTEDVYLREVIDLSRIRVRDIMVPRVEVTMFDVNRSPEELRELMRQTRLTKIPIYDEAVDEIVGLVYAKVLFFEPDKPLRELVTPVRFVPELITGEQLLQNFRQTRSQIAIAVDEFGGMAGLVTLEDVAEEIVGEIHDPEDRQVEPEIVQVSDTEYEISGRLSVHYWVEMFGISELTERVTTVAGLVTARLGRPANVDESVTIGNVRLTVTAADGPRIERLRLSLLDGPVGENGGVRP
jgi:CBS domain containing-hemolysin-like protein